ncbi:ABC transporter substrate-binding protein [soil metagenome]
MMVATLLTAVACGDDHLSSGSEPAAEASGLFPVTVMSCGDEVVFERAPERAVVNDDNMIEMMFALGLTEQMAAYSAAKPRLRPVEFREDYEAVESLGEDYFALEPLLGTNPDFVFSGWNYGFSADGINPESLAELGIPSYVLSESCRRIDQTLGPATIDDISHDIRALGHIFGVPERAEVLIAEWDERLQQVAERLPDDREPTATVGFLRGADAAIVAPGLTIVPELHRLAGARNVFEDLPAMWGPVSWEAFVDAAPELIVVTDYGNSADGERGEEKIALMLDDPALSDVPAIRDERFLVFPQEAVNPGIGFIGGIETLAAELYPGEFADLVGTPGFGLPETYDAG